MRAQSEVVNYYLDDLGDNHGKRLKDIALASIRSQLSGMRYRPRVTDDILHVKAGVYVTLKRDGELRGCAGFVYPTHEIWSAAKKAAIQAAFMDARFKQIERKELETLEIEISVIGQIEKLKLTKEKDAEAIRIGIDGIMVVGMGSSGMLLPQTATEMGFRPVEFLRATCEKAGLPEDSWREPSVSVYRFPTRIFS